MIARLRGWFRTRTGRLVVHDIVLAAAAGAAVLEGAHSLDAGVLNTAGVVALKVLLRVVFPVPSSNADPQPLSGDDATGIVGQEHLHRTLADVDVPPSTPRGARIAVVNLTQHAGVTSTQTRRWVRSVAAQAREFADEWGLAHPRVIYATKPPAPNRVDTVIAILDNADQANALGYHSETDAGVTYGRVFALDCQQAGVTVSSCLSHEVLEAIADLNVNRWVDAPDGREWALEVCDPVEADTYHDAADVELSSYVLPSFFDDAGAAPFDRLGRLSAPFTLSKNGYAVVRKPGRAQQVFGDRRNYQARQGWRTRTKASRLARTAQRLRR